MYTQGFMGWGYMRLCCHLVGSRSLIDWYATARGSIRNGNGVFTELHVLRKGQRMGVPSLNDLAVDGTQLTNIHAYAFILPCRDKLHIGIHIVLHAYIIIAHFAYHFLPGILSLWSVPLTGLLYTRNHLHRNIRYRLYHQHIEVNNVYVLHNDPNYIHLKNKYQ